MLVGLVLAGAAVRCTGFTRLDLWFDDAWAAMPSRAPLSTAVHMVVTSPGYTLFDRSFIRLHPGVSWWAQLPAFVLGLAGIVATYALLRAFRFSRTATVLGALVITVSPVAVTYSTRVKEYAFDLVASCLLLWLTERCRRDPSSRRCLELGAVSTLVVATSASPLVVVAGCWAALVVLGVKVSRARRPIAWGLLVAAVGIGTTYVAFLSKVPSVLNTNWKRRGYLLDTSSTHRLEHTLLEIFAGLPHGLLGTPASVVVGIGRSHWYDVVLAIATVVVLPLLLGTSVRDAWRSPEGIAATLPSAIAVAVAVIAALIGRVPLGDGRTDEVLYPALLIVAIPPLTRAWRLATARLTEGTKAAVRIGACGIVLVGAALFGTTHTAQYPTIDLRGLYAKIYRIDHVNDAIVVDSFNSFTWGLYDLTPTAISIEPDRFYQWPQGFHMVSTVPNVIISDTDALGSNRFASLSAHFHVLWYIGYDQGTYDVGTGPPNLAHYTGAYRELLREGWRPYTSAVVAEHCFAQPMVLAR